MYNTYMPTILVHPPIYRHHYTTATSIYRHHYTTATSIYRHTLHYCHLYLPPQTPLPPPLFTATHSTTATSIYRHPLRPQHVFKFDRVYDQQCTNKQIYNESVRPLIDTVFKVLVHTYVIIHLYNLY